MVIGVINLINDKQFKIRVKTDSQYLVDLYNEKQLTSNNANVIKYQNYDVSSFFVNLEDRVKSKNTENFQLLIEHVPGHTMDYGNLEGDWHVGYYLDKYVIYKNLLNSGLLGTSLLQQYIYESKRLKLVKQDHKLIVDPKHITTTFNIGDVVSLKNHP